MANNPFQPDEQDIPEGWDPNVDQDEKWKQLVKLMKKADDPRMPSDAQFTKMQRDIRLELFEQGLLAEDRQSLKKGLSFTEWLRIVLFDNNPGGQAVRLAVVGCVAFFAGTAYFQSQDSLDAIPAVSTTVSEADAVQLPALAMDTEERPAATQMASVSDTMSASQASLASQESAASSRTALPRSVMDDFESTGTWTPPIFDSIAVPTSGVTLPPNMGLSNYQRVESGSNGSGTMTPVNAQDLAARALEHVQVLKFYSLLNQDERSQAELRQVERTLSTLLMSNSHESQDHQVQAMEAYRSAELALAARRYGEAITIFDSVARQYPGTFTSFLAQFQIGRIAFERTRDYSLALDAYRKCLENYPGQFISDANKSHLIERVELLTRTSGHNWRALSLWHQAEETRDVEKAADHLMGILEISPYDNLTRAVAERLRQVILEDIGTRYIDHQEVLEVLMETINSSQDQSSAVAALYFTVGEILAFRSQDLPQAMQAYQRALNSNPDQALRQRIDARINSLLRQRVSAMTVIVD